MRILVLLLLSLLLGCASPSRVTVQYRDTSVTVER